MRRSIGCTVAVFIFVLAASAALADPSEDGQHANLVPELTLAYTDPSSGERIECAGDCRRLTVPAWTELEVRVRIRDEGGVDHEHKVTWDLWFNQPNHPFPGFDPARCADEAGRLDRGCWQSLVERVDRASWDALPADVVCVPGAEGPSCGEGVVRVPMDPDFDGARLPGVYHFAVWANRFGTIPEWDEFDNFAGPVRVTVEPSEGPARSTSGADRSAATLIAGSPMIVNPDSAMPYGAVVLQEEVDTSVSTSS